MTGGAADVPKPSDGQNVSAAIEENGAGLLLALGRAVGAEERDDGRVSWVIGNCPIDYHNAVARADLEPGEADVVIEASLARGT
ncbi:MAG: hypothetical protein ACRDTR_02730 [Rubrobacter sp.]